MAIGGTMYFRRNGTLQNATGTWSISTGGSKAVLRMALHGPFGFGEEPFAPMATGKVFKDETVSIATLQSIRNETLQFELDDGTSIVLRKASATGEFKIDPKTGEIDVEFTALSSEEVGA